MIFIKLPKIIKNELEVAAIFPERFWKAHDVYFTDFKFFEQTLVEHDGNDYFAELVLRVTLRLAIGWRNDVGLHCRQIR